MAKNVVATLFVILLLLPQHCFFEKLFPNVCGQWCSCNMFTSFRPHFVTLREHLFKLRATMFIVATIFPLLNHQHCKWSNIPKLKKKIYDVDHTLNRLNLILDQFTSDDTSRMLSNNSLCCATFVSLIHNKILNTNILITMLPI